jgi:5-methyltetrahydropteroyltriglutamate--homocysteine methyltransferase
MGKTKIETTMTGSWYRPPEILQLLSKSPAGEIDYEPNKEVILAAERGAIRSQVHPYGNQVGLTYPSNGEQRKGGYTQYVPNRYRGFSLSEKVAMNIGPALLEEFQESNPALLKAMQDAGAAVFSSPKAVERLEYVGGAKARRETLDAVRLAKEEGAEHIFINSASPGVLTIFFPRNSEIYADHFEYLRAYAAEQKKEYAAILDSDPNVFLQIDAPDLAMSKQIASGWGVSFEEALPVHVNAINEAVRGLPKERIRVHYCYGNYVGSHKSDADFEFVLSQVKRLEVGTIVGEAANAHHEGDGLILQDYVKEYGWPKGLRFAVGVIDVKTPIVETAQTVASRLEKPIRALGAENVLGGTDCGFETFAYFGNVTQPVAEQKLKALVRGAELASERFT